MPIIFKGKEMELADIKSEELSPYARQILSRAIKHKEQYAHKPPPTKQTAPKPYNPSRKQSAQKKTTSKARAAYRQAESQKRKLAYDRMNSRAPKRQPRCMHIDKDVRAQRHAEAEEAKYSFNTARKMGWFQPPRFQKGSQNHIRWEAKYRRDLLELDDFIRREKWKLGIKPHKVIVDFMARFLCHFRETGGNPLQLSPRLSKNDYCQRTLNMSKVMIHLVRRTNFRNGLCQLFKPEYKPAVVPTSYTIAKDTGMHQETVRDCVKALEHYGYLNMRLVSQADGTTRWHIKITHQFWHMFRLSKVIYHIQDSASGMLFIVKNKAEVKAERQAAHEENQQELQRIKAVRGRAGPRPSHVQPNEHGQYEPTHIGKFI